MYALARHTINAEANEEPGFREFADSMPHIIWTARPDGIVNFLNRAYAKITGIVPEVESQNWVNGLHPDDMDRTLAIWKVAITSGHSYSTEFRAIHIASGDYRWFAVQASPIRDYSGVITKWYGTAIDIHESRTAMEYAATRAMQLNATLEAISEGFIFVSCDCLIRYVNKAAEKELGQPRVNFLMKHFWEVFSQETGTRFNHEFDKALATGQPMEFEYLSSVLNEWYEIRLYPVVEGLSIYFKNIGERKKAKQEIERLAFYDQLTGLPNRQLLYDRMKHAQLVAARNRCFGAVMFIDLDNFKALNDTQGHAKGDMLLESVARRLISCARATDTVARLGGDEFVVVMDGIDGVEQEAATLAEQKAQKILTALNEPHELQGVRYGCRASIGVTLFSGKTEQITEPLKRADAAMYQAKAAGRNIIRFFDPAMQEAINHKLILEAALRTSIELNQFTLHYQPQMDCQQRLIGAEALLRWTHPVHNKHSPAVFIALAEETGLIQQIGKWVLDTACRQLFAWGQDSSTIGLSISVNVSGYQFRDPDFVQQVLDSVRSSGANPTRLKLELTETILVADIDDAIIKMQALEAHGIQFCLDDFGTGYSSLSYLRDLPLGQLKIDRSFISRIPGKAADIAIVQAIISMGHSLGFSIVAEGVETEEQLDFLRKQGCDGYQGYLFSRPLSDQGFQEFLRRSRQTFLVT